MSSLSVSLSLCLIGKGMKKINESGIRIEEDLRMQVTRRM